VIAPFNLNVIAQISALRIVDCLVEGTLVTVFATLLLRVTRRQSAATRFAVWFSALVAIAALPLLGSAWWSHADRTPAQALIPAAITLPSSWALYVVGAWAAIAGWALIRVGRGLWHLRVLRRSCIPVDPALLDIRLRETLNRNRSDRRVALCTSAQLQVPTALGLVKPAVVIPDWVMQELSPDELKQILLHERAHLYRYDDWTNLAQKVVKALLFFHPAVWWIEKRVSLEREMACDDAVLAETASPRAYAECLAHLAEKTLIQRSMVLAQAALGRIRHTSLRVAQILDANRPADRARSSKPAVSLVGAFAIAIACVLGSSRAPRLIAFSGGGASRATGSAIASPVIASGRMSTAIPVADASGSKTEFQPRPVRMVQAKLSLRATPPSLKNSEPVAVTPESRPARMLSRMQMNVGQMNVGQTNVRQTNVGLTNADVAPVVFTETLFVVVEGSENGSPDRPVFQIQLWRVMVLHPLVDADGNRIPPKQT
jgi:beta-lactamase regulating signal transducer with metallopeptidase domain